MIRTLADDTTRDIWNGVNSKAARRIPRALWPVVAGHDAYDVRCTDYH